MSRLRVCIVTGSRADYGLLYWVIRALKDDAYFDTCLVATGSHLAPAFGMTVQEIERDGWVVNERVEMLVSSNTPTGIAKSMALGLIGMSDAFARLAPDLVLLLGDRFEILVAAQACLMARIPVAHLAGGDITEGALDDSMRHAITKLSHIHFVSNTASRDRVIQMGENPANVHVVGNPGLDAFRLEPLMPRDKLSSALGRPLGQRNWLVILHPETLPVQSGDGLIARASTAAANALCATLDIAGQDVKLWVLMPNVDEGGNAIREVWLRWSANRDDVCLIENLARKHFLALMASCELMIGNSSSGLGEAPSLGLPVVDIGERQAGRLADVNVVRCQASVDSMKAAIATALRLDRATFKNPYGDGLTGPRIASLLKAQGDPAVLIRKRFHAITPAAKVVQC